MIAIAPKTLSSLVSATFAAAYYGIYFWRVFKANPGNRFVECGTITVAVFLSMTFFSQLGNIPDWLFLPWILLVVLLCFSTLFFLVQRGVRAFRHRKGRAR